MENYVNALIYVHIFIVMNLVLAVTMTLYLYNFGQYVENELREFPFHLVNFTFNTKLKFTFRDFVVTVAFKHNVYPYSDDFSSMYPSSRLDSLETQTKGN